MAKKAQKVPPIIDVKTIKVIRDKTKHLKDPIRFPNVIEPIEDGFTDDYVKMMNSMTKMLQVELVKQVKE
jgi:hypothetical protein